MCIVCGRLSRVSACFLFFPLFFFLVWSEQGDFFFYQAVVADGDDVDAVTPMYLGRSLGPFFTSIKRTSQQQEHGASPILNAFIRRCGGSLAGRFGVRLSPCFCCWCFCKFMGFDGRRRSAVSMYQGVGATRCSSVCG